ncbi:hypothetical protein [Brachybacterium hainanense]|uniref:DUF2207 domain-containing protein n=1 Tax=Brachybacterium hainanense TaxID=1541174 RepID=A0ABV6R8C5_9MICO
MSAQGTTPPVTAYRGHHGGHDYVVLARHGVLDARAVLVIDGVYHDPKKEEEPRVEATAPGVVVHEAVHDAVSGEADGLAFRAGESIRSIIYRVRRPGEDGTLADAETIEVRTTGLGGMGEVDVTGSLELRGTPLRPDPGSASAAREERKAAHPLRAALLAAGGKAAVYLVPLLGIGALFSGFLAPARRFVEGLVRPPVLWLGEVLAPVGEAIAAVRRFLFGWIPAIPWPDIHLPFLPAIPDWAGDVLVPVVVVALVGAAAWKRVRWRARRMDEAAGRADGTPGREEEPGSSSPSS